MNASEINFLSSREVIGFTLPVLHTKGGDWYVDFYAHDPATGKMRRKKYMLNKYKTVRSKRTVASLLIHNITPKIRRLELLRMYKLKNGKLPSF